MRFNVVDLGHPGILAAQQAHQCDNKKYNPHKAFHTPQFSFPSTANPHEVSEALLRGYFLNKLAPNTSVNTNNTRKMKNRALAIEAAPSAMPPKPNIAATIATTKNVTDQRNMIFVF